MVQYGGAHANEYVVLDFCPVYGYIVTHGNVVADFYHRLLIQGVQDGSVLNVDLVPQSDGVDIAAQYRVVPNAAIVAHLHIANNGGVFCQENIVSKFRDRKSTRLNSSHVRISYAV